MNTRQITYEHIVQDLPGGRRALYVLPAIPDDAPDQIREALARRRIAAIEGTCPCGADSPEWTRQQRRARERAKAKQAGRLTRATFEHEADCPAGDQILIPLLQAWIDGD